jgi:glycosyltransferase involved in cell wall biosynthesis
MQQQISDLSISVVVSTYNRPDALKACLDSLLNQTDSNFEIIIADDGSTDDTKALVNHYVNDKNITKTIRHVYQADQGFRLSRIRNLAIINSQGEYLIFIDGDCIALPDFVYRHRQLAAHQHFVAGNRVLLSQAFTKEILETDIHLYTKTFFYFLKLRLTNKINRLISFIRLPLGKLRYLQPYKWGKAVGCNTAFWKKDLLAVNGYDESFQGWGYEDSDLVIRLMHSGIKRKEGRFAVPVLHLWHPQNDRSNHDENYERLMQRLGDKNIVRAQCGTEQHNNINAK